MANAKYDNLAVMMAQGKFNWTGSIVSGALWKGATFDSTDIKMSEVAAQAGASQVASMPIQGRQVGADGSLQGWPLSFASVAKDTDYQLLLVAHDGMGDPALLAFYDENEAGDPLRIKNNGTLIVRPIATQDPDPPVLGIWITPST